ncbi:hypothetical protein FGIG_07025 [Fasciola gigantica]|uniref:Uncharacterized protein n=1 Tax=Fasciola gigantica TaxID=46835 RepID=A0A504YES8_FASGI|nr:hypothetical protein FGIG_07025 [Fasciola gigantica]
MIATDCVCIRSSLLALPTDSEIRASAPILSPPFSDLMRRRFRALRKQNPLAAQPASKSSGNSLILLLLNTIAQFSEPPLSNYRFLYHHRRTSVVALVWN